MTDNKELVQISADKISNLTGFSQEALAIIKKTVAKNTTDAELAYFASICQQTNLNPLTKEIWCYKDNRGNLLVFAGRDGFLKRAQESSLWNGITSGAVYENDTFEMDIASARIKHIPQFKGRGKIIGAYAIARPKGCEYATVEWADFDTYNKGQFVWKDFPEAMIKKVAEVNCLKKAFGITIIQSEFDFEVKGEKVEPITKNELDSLNDEIVELLETYKGDKTVIRDICKEKRASGEFTAEFAKGIITELKKEQEG